MAEFCCVSKVGGESILLKKKIKMSCLKGHVTVTLEDAHFTQTAVM